MQHDEYRFYSLPQERDAIVSLLPEISALSQRYAILPAGRDDAAVVSRSALAAPATRHQGVGFLGCPLSETELSERLRLIDSCHVAVTDSDPVQLAGYCYGYGAPSCRELLRHSSTLSLEERELFEHGARTKSDFSVNFQVAIDPQHVGHGLGSRLAAEVTQEVSGISSSACLLWVLLHPFNLMGFRVASKCEFRLVRTFASAAHGSFVWGELELHRGNGY